MIRNIPISKILKEQFQKFDIRNKLPSYIKAVLLMLIGLTCSIISDQFTKELVEKYPVTEITFMRSFIRLILLIIITLFYNKNLLISQNIKYHFIRSIFSILTIISFFFAYKYNFMTDVYALSYSSVIFIVFFSKIFLKEKVPNKILISVIIGIIGIVIALYPTSSKQLSIYSILPLSGAIFAAMNRVMIKKLTYLDHPFTIAIYPSFFIVLSLIPFYNSWIPFSDNKNHILLFLLMGSLSVVSQCIIIYATTFAKNVFLAPCDYFTFVIVIITDHIFWNHSIATNVLIGAITIITCNLSIIIREYIYEKKLSEH